ncbi:MAG: hypothetical protein L0Y60_14560, partial [Beijerinckiaceae bacterium]|nr:hypothetical protein [Beijerinckiaceae bacterium]
DLPSRDLDAARALLADMRAVADARGEPALWEQWAKAATNLMFDLSSRDLDAARALLADMRAVADARGEPALWEPWAKAAFNLIYGLRSRDPDAAHAFIEALPPEALKWLPLVIERTLGQSSQS